MTHSLFSDTITLYHKENDQYFRFVIEGVQWRQKIERFAFQRSQAGVFGLKTITTVTIPVGACEPFNITPCEGDVLVFGTGPKLTESYTIATLKSDFASYCTVCSVADNTVRPRLKHWKVGAV